MKNTLKFMAILCAICTIVQPFRVMANEASIPDDETSSQEEPSYKEDFSAKAGMPVKEEPAAQEAPSYKIISGDILQITVWKEEGLDQEVLVLPGGMINFPLVGSMNVQGQSPAQVQDTIKEKLRKLIPDAAVTVSVKAALGHTVSVIGQVTKPGEFVMGRHLTVMQALSQAGGLTPYASESGIIILRHDDDGKETSIPFPYDDVVEGDHLDKDIVLTPGDVVVVPTAGLL